jgi:hypothetical protein
LIPVALAAFHGLIGGWSAIAMDNDTLSVLTRILSKTVMSLPIDFWSNSREEFESQLLSTDFAVASASSSVALSAVPGGLDQTSASVASLAQLGQQNEVSSIVNARIVVKISGFL